MAKAKPINTFPLFCSLHFKTEKTVNFSVSKWKQAA